MRGWTGLYGTSVELGVRQLARGDHLREAVRRIVIPLDPSRYLELPWAMERLAARRGDRVLDLASPKLLAVHLARRGIEVTTVDQLEREIGTWRAVGAGEPLLHLEVADGRALPFEEASFDHAYSISVLEHIPDDGDAIALRELARMVRPGGRVLVTLPHAPMYREDWLDGDVFANEPVEGRASSGGTTHLESTGSSRWYRRSDWTPARSSACSPTGTRHTFARSPGSCR
jgi:SAM-dependent methyltransferase